MTLQVCPSQSHCTQQHTDSVGVPITATLCITTPSFTQISFYVWPAIFIISFKLNKSWAFSLRIIVLKCMVLTPDPWRYTDLIYVFHFLNSWAFIIHKVHVDNCMNIENKWTEMPDCLEHVTNLLSIFQKSNYWYPKWYSHREQPSPSHYQLMSEKLPAT